MARASGLALLAALAATALIATPAAGAVKASPTTDLARKPVIPKQRGKPPVALVKQDVVKGTGRAARRGDEVSVRYVGALWPTARPFDSNWGRNDEPFRFLVGGGTVIKGFDSGVLGMRVGGRRQLTIPPRLAYGRSGQATIPGNATLIFVIDLVET